MASKGHLIVSLILHHFSAVYPNCYQTAYQKAPF